MDAFVHMGIQAGVLIQIPMEEAGYVEDCNELIRDLAVIVEKYDCRVEPCPQCPGCSVWVGLKESPRWTEWEQQNAQ